MNLISLFPVIGTWLGLPTLLAKVLFAVKFIFYRTASWSGTLYLYKKGKSTGRKIYFVYAVLVYMASWLIVLYGTSWLIRMAEHWVKMHAHA